MTDYFALMVAQSSPQIEPGFLEIALATLTTILLAGLAQYLKRYLPNQFESRETVVNMPPVKDASEKGNIKEQEFSFSLLQAMLRHSDSMEDVLKSVFETAEFYREEVEIYKKENVALQKRLNNYRDLYEDCIQTIINNNPS